MSRLAVKTIPISHCGRLDIIFGQALESDFAYFEPEYRKSIHKANSKRKLTMASLNPRRQLLGLYDDQELVGYSISALSSNNTAFLFWLYVSPKHRGQKNGIYLLDETESRLKTRNVDTIELITHNQRGFYERHDYHMSKIMLEIAAGVDMYVMSKKLA